MLRARGFFKFSLYICVIRCSQHQHREDSNWVLRTWVRKKEQAINICEFVIAIYSHSAALQLCAGVLQVSECVNMVNCDALFLLQLSLCLLQLCHDSKMFYAVMKIMNVITKSPRTGHGKVIKLKGRYLENLPCTTDLASAFPSSLWLFFSAQTRNGGATAVKYLR